MWFVAYWSLLVLFMLNRFMVFSNYSMCRLYNSTHQYVLICICFVWFAWIALTSLVIKPSANKCLDPRCVLKSLDDPWSLVYVIVSHSIYWYNLIYKQPRCHIEHHDELDIMTIFSYAVLIIILVWFYLQLWYTSPYRIIENIFRSNLDQT